MKKILNSTNIGTWDSKDQIPDKVLLKHAVLAFIGNLCVDPQLRQIVANNTEDILDEVYHHFEKDIART